MQRQWYHFCFILNILSSFLKREPVPVNIKVEKERLNCMKDNCCKSANFYLPDDYCHSATLLGSSNVLRQFNKWIYNK
jgi:hypothetical protein